MLRPGCSDRLSATNIHDERWVTVPDTDSKLTKELVATMWLNGLVVSALGIRAQWRDAGFEPGSPSSNSKCANH